jgi:hypothetical protein
MYIIVKKFLDGSKDKVLNTFYGDNVTIVKEWIRGYISQEIDSLQMSPTPQNLRNIAYSIEENDDTFALVKSFKQIHKGYIYNSSERVQQTLYNIDLLECEGKFEESLKKNDLWVNLNDNINNRVLRQMDKDSLYQVFIKIQSGIHKKESWNHTEFTSLISEIVKSFKKDLYSSIAKRMKRVDKKKSAKRNEIHTTLKNWNGSSCRLDELKKRKQD